MTKELRDNSEKLKVKVERSTGDRAKEIFGNFVTSLEKKYPNKAIFIERYDGDTAYTATVNNQIAGVLLGSDMQPERHFNGSFILVDEKYRRSDIGKSLIDAAKSEFESFSLQAAAFALNLDRGDATSTRRRNRALIKYYQRMGFELIDSYHNIMIWKKKYL
ncbi:GNAT family N-acetyltransferase [Candidatus Kaiserbacteria bacterium]|nr:GNAT family N-acetyltransferase [Candidatus Kaiserbacteria bacterium]